MYSLLFANIPHDCDEIQFRNWFVARGVGVRHIRLISDVIMPDIAQLRTR
jgi:hypothetical protein